MTWHCSSTTNVTTRPRSATARTVAGLPFAVPWPTSNGCSARLFGSVCCQQARAAPAASSEIGTVGSSASSSLWSRRRSEAGSVTSPSAPTEVTSRSSVRRVNASDWVTGAPASFWLDDTMPNTTPATITTSPVTIATTVRRRRRMRFAVIGFAIGSSEELDFMDGQLKWVGARAGSRELGDPQEHEPRRLWRVQGQGRVLAQIGVGNGRYPAGRGVERVAGAIHLRPPSAGRRGHVHRANGPWGLEIELEADAVLATAEIGGCVLLGGPSDLGPTRNDDDAGNVIVPGGSEIGWSTEEYATADLGGGKDGVGLQLDLQSPGAVGAVNVTAAAGPWSAEVYTSDEAFDTAPSGLPAAAGTDLGQDATLTLDSPQSARFVLLWITELPRTGSGANPFQLTIHEVQLFG